MCEEGYLPFPNIETVCVHNTKTENVDAKDPKKEIGTPLILSNFYDSKESCLVARYVSGRVGNTTRCILENVIAILSKAKYGLCFASGAGAIAAVLGLLKTGDNFIVNDDIYSGTMQYFLGLGSNVCIHPSFVDFCRMDNVENAIREDTKMIWTENPTNSKLKVIDLCCTSTIGQRHKLITVTDNTFLTPFLQRPLEFGIDIVVNSLSNYINGHNDVIMGSVCTNNKRLYERLKDIQINFGHVPSPFDCYQVLRSLKTFPQRMRRHNKNGLEIAKYLTKHPKIAVTIHPGLPTHPQHELFKKQTSGHSGIIAAYIRGCLTEAKKLTSNVKLFTQAVSVGGYNSLIEIPALDTHSNIPQEMKECLGLTENLLRISVGLEDPCDLINDLDQALEKV